MGQALVIPSAIQMAEDMAISGAIQVFGEERVTTFTDAIPDWVPRPDFLACQLPGMINAQAGQFSRDASALAGYDCDHWSTALHGGSGAGGDGDDNPFPDGAQDGQAAAGQAAGTDPWLADPAVLDLPLPLNVTAEYAARFNAAKEARDAARAQEAAALTEAIAAAAAAAAAAAVDAALRTPLDASGPGANQGNPQPIPYVGGDPVQEIEPQRVYNQDYTDLPSYMRMPTNQNELNYDGNGGSSLPVMTIGAVAIGGVLIFLWNSRRG